jgi:hypothetical protein
MRPKHKDMTAEPMQDREENRAPPKDFTAANKKLERKTCRGVAFNPEFARAAQKICALGGTEADLAFAFNTTVGKIRNWQASQESFNQACRLGRSFAESRVTRSLYQRACGYDCIAEKVFHFEGRPIVAQYLRHVPASVRAGIFWLVNRCPAQWSYLTELKK